MRPLKLRIQAFGSYVDEQVLDFETALADAPFLLIHGATGSGKTTILDAIVFALYGESSGDIREGAMLRSSTAPPDRTTEMEYVFSLGQRRYRVLRSPAYSRMSRGKMTRRAATGQLFRLPDVGKTGEEKLLAANITDVSERISQLIGFDADQFRQVVLLPQGQFQRFLLAEVKDRSEIMQRIFRTERYQRIEEALTKESQQLERTAEAERERAEGILRSEGMASSDELRTRLSALSEEIRRQDEILLELEKAQKSARRAREEGAAAQQKLSARDAAQSDLKKRREQAESVRDFRVRLSRAQRAQPVLYKEHSYIDALNTERTRREAYASAEKDCAAAKTEHDASVACLKQVESHADEHTKNIEQLRRMRDYESLASRYQECTSALRDLRVRAAEGEEKYKRSAAEIERLTDAQKKHEAERTRLHQIMVGSEVVQQEKKQLAQCQKTSDHIRELEDALTSARTRVQKAQKKLQTAERELSDARTTQRRLRTLYDMGSAARLAQTLQADTPCPVCGSLAHPSPAVHAEEIPSAQEMDECTQHVETAEKELQKCTAQAEQEKAACLRLEQELLHEQKHIRELLADESMEAFCARVAEREKQISRAQDACKALEKTYAEEQQRLSSRKEQQKEQEALLQKNRNLIGRHEGERNTLERQLPEEYRDADAVRKAAARLEREVKTAETARVEAEKREKAAAQECARTESAKAAARRALKEAEEVRQAAQEAYTTAYRAADFLTEEEYHHAVAGDWAKSDYLEKVRERIAAYDTAFQAAEELVKAAEAAAEGLCPPDMEALTEAERIADQRVQDSARAQGIRMERRALYTRMIKEMDALERAGAARDKRYRVIGKLANVAAAKPPYQIHFQTYVLRSILSDVIDAANERLMMMSRGRYRFIHGEGGQKKKWWGLEIDVFDEYTGFPRLARTLSGGETFLASLSLALGLSDVVQHYAGGMHLDMIFIDEGFGSLDSETLDVAIRALLDVQREGGRLVGIISHIEELRARIPVHLEVCRGQNGSYASFTQNGGLAI